MNPTTMAEAQVYDLAFPTSIVDFFGLVKFLFLVVQAVTKIISINTMNSKLTNNNKLTILTVRFQGR